MTKRTIKPVNPLYAIYYSMVYRCMKPNYQYYKNYGGRGITVCDRWLGKDGRKNFLDDMGLRPTPSHTLDRIDNDKGYSPENCKWSTRHEQAKNKTNNSDHVGVYYDPTSKLWVAHMMYHSTYVLNSRHTTFEEAWAARKSAELKYLGAII